MRPTLSQGILDYKPQNDVGGAIKIIWASIAAMSELTDGTASRLKHLREQVLGFETQQEMANFLGVSFNRYNNSERGLPLSHDLAVLICQKVPGMTLDWLYFGKPDGLPLALARRMGEAPMAITGLSDRG